MPKDLSTPGGMPCVEVDVCDLPNVQGALCFGFEMVSKHLNQRNVSKCLVKQFGIVTFYRCDNNFELFHIVNLSCSQSSALAISANLRDCIGARSYTM